MDTPRGSTVRTPGTAHPMGGLCPRWAPPPPCCEDSPRDPRMGPDPAALNHSSAHAGAHGRCFISSQPRARPGDLGAGCWQQAAAAALWLCLNTGEVQAGSASPRKPSLQCHSLQKEKPWPNLPSLATEQAPSQGKGCCSAEPACPDRRGQTHGGSSGAPAAAEGRRAPARHQHRGQCRGSARLQPTGASA